MYSVPSLPCFLWNTVPGTTNSPSILHNSTNSTIIKKELDHRLPSCPKRVQCACANDIIKMWWRDFSLAGYLNDAVRWINNSCMDIQSVNMACQTCTIWNSNLCCEQLWFYNCHHWHWHVLDKNTNNSFQYFGEFNCVQPIRKTLPVLLHTVTGHGARGTGLSRGTGPRVAWVMLQYKWPYTKMFYYDVMYKLYTLMVEV